jgi:microcystin-dependent protein
LFSLLGTTYGGNGQTTFALPNLAARVPISMGQGPGLSNYDIGTTGGTDSVTLTTNEMPSHSHAIDSSGLSAKARCTNGTGNQKTPVGGVPAKDAAGTNTLYSLLAPDGIMSALSVVAGGSVTAGTTGSGQPHENRQPYLVLNYCIALQGVFPSRF